MIVFYVAIGLLVAIGVAVAVMFGLMCESVAGKTTGIVIGAVIAIATVVVGSIYLHTASGSRLQKSWQSEVQNGINRTVTVYDIGGKEIKSYSGKFDVDYDEDRIIFDDENGKRHVIYYTTGTVIIDEK